MTKQHDTIAIRLTVIISKLNSGVRFCINDLVAEFNVSKRTVQRDINQRLSYLPLKKENGYYFLEEYCLGKLNYNDIKNFATLSGIRDLYPSLNDEFIVDLLNSKLDQNYIIKGYDYEDLKSKSKEFYIISSAIATSHNIKFRYKNKARTVAPYKLVNTDGIWYLVADEQGTLKTYSFNKILNPIEANNTFEQNKEFKETISKNEATWFSQTVIKVTLHVDSSIAEYFLRRKLLPSQVILEKNAQYLTVSAKVSYEEEILRIVRYWIPHIKIIEPTCLQKKLEEQLKSYM